jgi:hypothetical protein
MGDDDQPTEPSFRWGRFVVVLATIIAILLIVLFWYSFGPGAPSG